MKESVSVRALDQRLQNVAGKDQTLAYRLRVTVANVVVGQMLPPGAVKGGTAMKIRLGESGSRFTPDLDTARREQHRPTAAAAQPESLPPVSTLPLRSVLASKQQRPRVIRSGRQPSPPSSPSSCTRGSTGTGSCPPWRSADSLAAEPPSPWRGRRARTSRSSACAAGCSWPCSERSRRSRSRAWSPTPSRLRDRKRRPEGRRSFRTYPGFRYGLPWPLPWPFPPALP